MNPAHSHFSGNIMSLYESDFLAGVLRLLLLGVSTVAWANSKTTDNANNASLPPHRD
jgi:hypothetical protein